MPCTVGHGEAGCACIQRGSSAISSHLLVCSQSRELMVTDPVPRRVCAPQLPGAPGNGDVPRSLPVQRDRECCPQARGDAELAVPAPGAQDGFCLDGRVPVKGLGASAELQ